MQNTTAIEGLKSALENTSEHPMVRHEAAEALGAIGTEQVQDILISHKNDKDTIVKESCDVALDIIEYWANESQ